MKAYLLSITLAALLVAPAALGQSQGQQSEGRPAEAGTKVGILDVRAAIINSAEGKQASAELQSQFSPRQAELDGLRRQIEDVQNRLRAGERTLSDEERARLGRQLNQLSRLYQRKEEDLREDLGLAEDEVVQRIGMKMMELINRYARENGYSVILDVSGQGPVIYASNQVNITEDIVRLYDQAHPVSSSGQARPQPGQPRPQP